MAGVLLSTFTSDQFDLVPCFHSVRRSGRLETLRLPFRLLSDLATVVRGAKGASGLHMTLQYRRAIAREFAVAVTAKLLGLPLLADVRAGSFIRWYESASSVEKKMTAYVLTRAKEITVEGLPYLEFIKEEFGRDATYFPNFVPQDEIPDNVEEKCGGDVLQVLFIGYCYEGKGVKELVEGCALAAQRGVSIRLTLAGSESDEFRSWMDARGETEQLVVVRAGGLDHKHVLELYDEHDVFCLPTRHPGEGHSNSINEAMMKGMVIVTTRHGFLPSLLDNESCYFVEKRSPASIARAFQSIVGHPQEARIKAKKARETLVRRFSSVVQIPVLEEVYRRLAG